MTPEQGRTVLAHVQELMRDVSRVIFDVQCAVHPLRRIRPAEREKLRRDLAGVISKCESVRIWLDAGAPR